MALHCYTGRGDWLIILLLLYYTLTLHITHYTLHITYYTTPRIQLTPGNKESNTTEPTGPSVIVAIMRLLKFYIDYWYHSKSWIQIMTVYIILNSSSVFGSWYCLILSKSHECISSTLSYKPLMSTLFGELLKTYRI